MNDDHLDAAPRDMTMKIEIKATIHGQPAYCVIELPDVQWFGADMTRPLSVNLLPASIQRVDLVDDYGNRLTIPS